MLTEEELFYLQLEYKDKNIEVTTDKGVIAGNCYFIGYNPFFPEWQLQVTVGRMPLTNVDPKNIKLL